MITYMTACCWNNFALSATEEVFKIRTIKTHLIQKNLQLISICKNRNSST